MTTLEKIRAEIAQLQDEWFAETDGWWCYEKALQIIDKYAEQEPCEDNRLYIKVYADLEPQEKAEKLYQICEEEELLEVYKELGKYCDIEPCDDVVSREMALKECYDIVIDGERYRVIQEETLLGLPSVRPQEQTGHWIDDTKYGGTECSECGKWYPHATIAKSEIKYCSECGAKMVEPQESEEVYAESNN